LSICCILFFSSLVAIYKNFKCNDFLCFLFVLDFFLPSSFLLSFTPDFITPSTPSHPPNWLYWIPCIYLLLFDNDFKSVHSFRAQCEHVLRNVLTSSVTLVDCVMDPRGEFSRRLSGIRTQELYDVTIGFRAIKYTK